MVEAPPKWGLELKKADMDRSTLDALPPSEPYNWKSVWAHGCGGHLHESVLFNSFTSNEHQGVHPSAVFSNLMQLCQVAVTAAKLLQAGSMTALSVSNFVRVVLPVGRDPFIQEGRAWVPEQRAWVTDSSVWVPAEHQVHLVEHEDKAVLVALAIFFLNGELVMPQVGMLLDNFAGVRIHVPRERQYRLQVQHGWAPPSLESSLTRVETGATGATAEQVHIHIPLRSYCTPTSHYPHFLC